MNIDNNFDLIDQDKIVERLVTIKSNGMTPCETCAHNLCKSPRKWHYIEDPVPFLYSWSPKMINLCFDGRKDWRSFLYLSSMLPEMEIGSLIVGISRVLLVFLGLTPQDFYLLIPERSIQEGGGLFWWSPWGKKDQWTLEWWIDYQCDILFSYGSFKTLNTGGISRGTDLLL